MTQLPETPRPEQQPRIRSPRWRDDEGSTLPLVAGFGALALALILVVAAASSLYLERKQLFTLADGAALVGAEAFSLGAVEADAAGGAPVLQLEPDDVHRDVVRFLASTPNSGLEGLVLEEATTPDGRSATVTLSAIWRPPVVTVFFPEGLRIEATATARAVFG